jgi:uncharacterized membrane protein YciS (DUF1049 family)
MIHAREDGRYRLYLQESQRNIKQKVNIKIVRLLMAALFSALLALMLLVSVFYVNSQRKRLALTGRKLKISNAQLHEINSKLSELNRQLASSIAKLGESNRVKEEYIGRFMGLVLVVCR